MLSSSENVSGAFHGPEAMRGMRAGMGSGTGGRGGVVCEGSVKGEQVGDGRSGWDGRIYLSPQL